MSANYSKNAKIAVRNVRKDVMDTIKKFKSDGMSEDEPQLWSEEIQQLTMIKKIDELQKEKQAEINNFFPM